MKRVYLILTLFITSFFFVSLNKVSAATYEYEVFEADFEYFDDDFFILRKLVINHSNLFDKNYIITVSFDSSTTATLSAYVFDNTIICNLSGSNFFDNKNVNNRIPFITCNSNSENIDLFSLSSDKTSLSKLKSLNSVFFPFRSMYSSSISNQHFSMHFFLDSNFQNFTPNTLNTTIIKYNDLTYQIPNNEEQVPTLYQIYYDAGLAPEEPKEPDKFESEKELMNNFYSTIFVKISNLATDLTDNYIFLLIFTIFIFIFAIELIRRYLL